MTTTQNWLKTCPLCGADNQCGMAAGNTEQACWCKEVTIDPAALKAIPADSIGKRCLCPSCGQKNGETHAR